MISVAKAWLYEQYRLPYAPAAIDDLLERIDAPGAVADIGAGTGQLARMLARRCPKIYAIEPDPSIRQVASSVLAAEGAIEVRAGSAEQTTLGDHCVDLIVIGNAFHRFRPEACDEMRRILRPGGWIALISYRFTQQAHMEMLFSRLAQLQGLADRISKAWHKMPLEALFEVEKLQRLTYSQSLREDWTAFFGSACAGVEAPEQQDAEYGQFEEINRDVFEAYAKDGRLEIVYETEVVFGQPRPGKADGRLTNACS